MAEARVRFGAQSSAEEKYGTNPVYLHSQILKRLKCFGGNISKRWSSDKPTEIWVTTSHNFDHYLKCIEIMYGEHVDFPNIEECLGILSVASEMLADDCINKCMQYLEAVRWSAEQESRIRNVLSRKGLKVSPDLAARLHQDDNDHINFVEKIIQEMVSLIKQDSSALSKSREAAEKDLAGILDGNASRDVVDVCGRVLLQEFQESIKSRDLSILTRLFNLIQHCDGGILEAAFKAFCENAELTKHIKNVTGNGKIIISRASRVSFVTTWLPIMVSFKYHISPPYKFGQLDKAVLNVVESLPQVDQKRICVFWAQVYRLNKIEIATPFNLSKSLFV